MIKALTLSLALASPAGAFELAFPLACDLGKTCYIQQYADHDPSAGADDFNHHRTSRLEQLRDFREADHGYRSNYGDKLVYQRQYRDGFEQGFRDGLRGIR